MSEQRQFDFKRASKLNALERVVCAGGVKALLKALDAFARDAVSYTVTIRRLAVSMGVSESTARRAIRTAQGEGLLTVEGKPTDGSANEYTINWQAVFALPDGVQVRRRRSSQPPVERSVTPVKLEGDPCQVERGPLSNWKGTPVRLKGVSATDHSDQVNDTVRPARSATKTRTDGGGDFGLQDSEKAIGAVVSALALRAETLERPKPSGWWAWKVKRANLLSQSSMWPLFEAAVNAGFLEHNPLSEVRFLALTRTINGDADIKNVTGYLVSMIEGGGWNYLDPGSIDIAYRIVCPKRDPLTEQQKARIMTPQPRGMERAKCDT